MTLHVRAGSWRIEDDRVEDLQFLRHERAAEEITPLDGDGLERAAAARHVYQRSPVVAKTENSP